MVFDPLSGLGAVKVGNHIAVAVLGLVHDRHRDPGDVAPEAQGADCYSDAVGRDAEPPGYLGRLHPARADRGLEVGEVALEGYLGGHDPKAGNRLGREAVLSPLPHEAVLRYNLRQEPSAVIPHAGICGGGRGQPRSLLQLIKIHRDKRALHLIERNI